MLNIKILYTVEINVVHIHYCILQHKSKKDRNNAGNTRYRRGIPVQMFLKNKRRNQEVVIPPVYRIASYTLDMLYTCAIIVGRPLLYTVASMVDIMSM